MPGERRDRQRRRVRAALDEAEARIETDAIPLGPDPSDAARWCEQLLDPETLLPFALYEEQRAFLRAALTLTAEGRLPFPELVFGAPKKAGKTALAAMVALYVAVEIGGRFAEVYIYANDLDQATGRVFQACARIVEATPWLRQRAEVFRDRIEFPATGASIRAMASDAASAAGSNPSLSIFDELWAYTGERAHRLWDEAVPSPTRLVSGRLTVTYAGFEGESEPLESLYRRGVAGEVIGTDLRTAAGLLCYWTHELRAPWQSEAWREQMRHQLRPTAYLRMIENRWTSGESEFVPLDWWDACADVALRPMLAEPALPVWVGVDASIRRDSTALVAVTFDKASQRVRLVRHAIFQPSPDRPLDFEATVERVLLEWRFSYSIRAVWFDPFQMIASAQRLRRLGVQMVEFPQSIPNLTEASSNLYELVKGRNLWTYPDAQLRLAVSRAVAVEMPRGWRISKRTQSHRIDVVVALGMAALAASRGGPGDGVIRRGSFSLSHSGGWVNFGNRMGHEQAWPSPYSV